MTASAPIAGTLRAIPDAALALPPDSGIPAHANFRSVLEQSQAPRESDANSNDPKNTRDRKQSLEVSFVADDPAIRAPLKSDLQRRGSISQKDSDPTTNLAVPQPVAPTVETPRLILPFTASFALRQDATTSPDDTVPHDATASPDDAAAAPDSTTAAADPKAVVFTPVIFRSMIDQRGVTLDSTTKTESAPSETQPKTHTKSHAKLQAKSTDSVPAKTGAAPLAPTKTTADPSAPVLPVTPSTTPAQTIAAVQISSNVDDAPDAATAPAPVLERRTSFLAITRNAAYQYHSSPEVDSAMAATNRPAQQQRKVSDPSAAIAVPVPVAETVEPQRLLHAPAAPPAPKQEAPAAQSSSAVTQDSSVASATDSKTVMPALDRADDTTAAQPAGALAFAAKLTPEEEKPAPTPEASRTIDSQTRVPTGLQSATPATAKQIASEADLPADAHSGESGSPSDRENRFAKPEIVLPQTHATFPDQPAAPAASHASASPLTPAARMDQVQEPPATAPSGNHDITIRIADSNTEQGTAVRFVERAGEVHVSVRTGDAEMAQTLRGGLNDLVNRLEDGGIRTQVWQPGTDSSTSQNDSHHPFADPDGSNGRQFSSGSNSEQESKQHNKPRWVDELEGSIGNPNFKETTQILWQA